MVHPAYCLFPDLYEAVIIIYLNLNLVHHSVQTLLKFKYETQNLLFKELNDVPYTFMVVLFQL